MTRSRQSRQPDKIIDMSAPVEIGMAVKDGGGWLEKRRRLGTLGHRVARCKQRSRQKATGVRVRSQHWNAQRYTSGNGGNDALCAGKNSW